MDPSTANISVREYIYFLPYPLPPGTPVPYSTGLPERNPLGLPPQQFEPTSTLVLTTPLRTFVDVRVFKPLSRDDPAALPNHGQPDRLDWAFAGFSTSKCVVSPEHASREHREDVTHSTWNHWVDSRYPACSPDIPVDEGDMYPISRGLTLEHGHAFHPSLRTHKSHEEMWRDVPVISTPATGLKFCIVLRVEDDAQKLRGMIVRIGQFCQGISMNGGACTVERWQWTAEAEEKEANGVPDKNLGWKRTIRIGNHFLPCAATFRPELLSVGGRVKYHTADWKVEECWQWA
ncbi:hypothetical protein IQ07DRAFT_511672 [Pyrenochaeta sp. DS3sAY3a]|nr:hypothetical protein IQ07DRAFT_511672 [Pyrenochaeta sp. DS3sAY3a]